MEDYSGRDLLTAQESLVEEGKFHFGTFRNQFRKVNPLDAKLPLGLAASRPFLAFRLKEWQAFQLGNERWFVLVVLYNSKVSALTQFIAYDKENKKKYIFEKILPAWKINVPASIWDESQSYRDKDRFIEIVSQLAKGKFYINVKVKGDRTSPDMEGISRFFMMKG